MDLDDKSRHVFRQIFDARVATLIEDGKEFNFDYLSADIMKVIEKQTKNKFMVYFGVPIKKSEVTPLPFKRSIKLNEIIFNCVTVEQFERAHKDCLDDYYQKCNEYIPSKYDKKYVLEDLVYFRATVEAADSESAANTAGNAFQILFASASVAQGARNYRHTMGGSRTKSRSIIPPPGIMQVAIKGHKKCQLMWSSDVRMISDEALKFTDNKSRIERFHLYLRIYRGTLPIDKRIRLLLFEYAGALHAEEPHVRQLSLWRCLELGTSRAGSSRPEKEVVQILSNYYNSIPHWPQQGKIIKDIRNKFVHQGATLERDIWGSVDKYLNWTQEYVDTLLSILLWLRKSGLGTKERDIDDFFDLYSKPKSTLRVAAKMLGARTRAERSRSNK